MLGWAGDKGRSQGPDDRLGARGFYQAQSTKTSKYGATHTHTEAGRQAETETETQRGDRETETEKKH